MGSQQGCDHVTMIVAMNTEGTCFHLGDFNGIVVSVTVCCCFLLKHAHQILFVMQGLRFDRMCSCEGPVKN